MKGQPVKNQKMEELMKQKAEDKKNHFDTVLTSIQIKNLELSDHLLVDYPNFKDFQLFILQYTEKKVIKLYILVICFFTG